jgi:hypothetical protein
LVDFYRARIDWGRLLENLKRKGTDRLLVAYIYYGRRELGLTLPPELEQFNRQGPADLALIDAVVGSSDRLAAYSNRTSLAVLTGPTRQERLKKLWQWFVRDCIMVPIGTRRPEQGARIALHHFKIVIRICLQLVAVLHVSAYKLRHSIWEGKGHVG